MPIFYFNNTDAIYEWTNFSLFDQIGYSQADKNNEIVIFTDYMRYSLDLIYNTLSNGNQYINNIYIYYQQ